jgi:hypothetical protein
MQKGYPLQSLMRGVPAIERGHSLKHFIIGLPKKIIEMVETIYAINIRMD